MKKNNIKKKVSKLQKPTIKFDIDNIKTYDDMIVAIASSKINAGYGIDVSEFMHIIADEDKSLDKTITVLLESFTDQIVELVKEKNELTRKLAWATRPWYKKLMFWKKNPNK